MANFRTHLGTGTVVSGLLATLAFAASIVNDQDLLSIALAGVLGSILPDVDLQKSRPSRIIFFFLAIFFSFCILFAQSGQLSVLELWIVWLGVFVGVRYLAQLLFHHFAVHRGIFHSVLAALFFMFVTAIVFTHILGKEPLVSWIAGVFLFLGYMVHLSLDELYSVDFEGNRVKRSFGTALKLYEYRNIKTSGAMAIITLGLFWLTPPTTKFLETLKERPLLTVLMERFLPEGTIFNLDKHLTRVVKNVAPTPTNAASEQPEGQEPPKVEDEITTGAIPPKNE